MGKKFYKILIFCFMASVFSMRIEAQVVDGIAAVVNEKVITFSQVKREVAEAERYILENKSGLEAVEEIRRERINALKALIERELIIQEFSTKGFFIPANVVEDRFQGMIKKQYEGDRTALIKTLHASGVTVAAFKQELKNQMIVSAMRSRNVSSTLMISPYQIEEYYQENIREFLQPDQAKVRVIFMRKGIFKEKRRDKDGKEIEVDPQQLIMEEILQKVETGSDFGNLARSYSEGPQRLNNGDLGWVSGDTLRRELSEAVFALRPGQTSRVIATKDGYYVVKVEDFRKATVKPLADVRSQIEVTLLQEERQRLQEEWLDKLRTTAFIKTFY